VSRALVVVVSVIVVALGGCGGGSSSSSTPSSSRTTRLVIDAETGPSEGLLHTSRATLHCDGSATATGFLSGQADAACALVHQGAVQHVRSEQHDNRVCSQIYGGPQRATITGTIDGEPVRLTVTRTDGCGTADWQTLEPLLGRPER
jgi:hypothetical protein